MEIYPIKKEEIKPKPRKLEGKWIIELDELIYGCSDEFKKAMKMKISKEQIMGVKQNGDAAHLQ